ncbi:MAG: VOC family protein [Acidobacteriota bacterium]|nr:VOC family protein [Acidobacteriota bacterium]
MADAKPMKLHHVSLAVNDAKAVAETWEKVLGIGPWKLNAEMGGVDAKGRNWKANEYWAQIGDTVIELIEPLEGRIVQSRYLDETGPGVHHMAFEVESVEETLAHMLENGAELVFHEPGNNWAYLRTGGPDGVIVEISQH